MITPSTLLTVGTFDLFHVGHLHLLQACRLIVGEYGTVTVGCNTDDFVETYKPARPRVEYKDRVKVLRSCRYVDNVIPNADADLRGMLIKVKPTFLAIGSDWKEGDAYFKQTGLSQEWLDEGGIYMLYIGRPANGVSSSLIKTLLD